MSANLPAPEERFLIDLEFVQNLSNPKYLNYLAMSKYFEQEEFINYLKYLRDNFSTPPYNSFIIFPQSLAFLNSIINDADFRRELALPQFIEYLHQQQGSHWMHVTDDIIAKDNNDST